MIRKLSIMCVSLSAVFLLVASYFLINNLLEAERARKKSEEVVVLFENIIDESVANEITVPAEEYVPLPDVIDIVPEAPETETDPVEIKMAEVEIDGHRYIGYLMIPSLEQVLPIMSDWDYQKLEIAPGRYQGSVNNGDLVLTAHNYPSHFGNIHKLQAGDLLKFLDVNNVETAYQVVKVEVIEPTAIDEVISGVYELVLFTCTYGGQSRVAVFCNQT